MKSSRGAWLVFGVLLISYAWFFQGGGYNANSRLALTRALAEGHSVAIDAYPVTGDWAEYGGHRYTNKAPGLSFVSAPVWALLRPESRGPALSVPGWVTNLFVNAVPSALLGVLVFQALGQLGCGGVSFRVAAALAFGLGTLAFPYATAYYAHQPAAVASFGAFFLLLRTNGRWRGALAGALAGLAVLMEVSAALTVAILGLYLLGDARRRALLPGFVLGGLPLAIVLGAYNAAAFGSPLSFWFDHANPAIEARVDGQLFGLPTPSSVLGLLILPYRGLFYTSPLLALAPFGWRALWRGDRGVAAVCAAVPLAFLALNACFHGWYGGWTPGARYLVPCLPFLFLPVAFAMARWPGLGAGLAAASVAMMLALTAVATEVPHQVANPLLDFAAPRLFAGQVAVNPQALDEEAPPESYLDGTEVANASSFNLGEPLFGSSPLSLLPLLLVWAACGVWVWRAERVDAAQAS